MKLLYKHIRKSVFKAPKETIIIIFTIVLSAILFSLIGEVDYLLREEKRLDANQSFGKSDIEISADISSNTRYMTSSSYNAITDKIEYAEGYLTTPALYDGIMAKAASADLNTIENIFPFSFISVIPVSERELENAIYISARFSDENQLKIGDSITLSILGKDKSFTVYGINRHPFFGSFDLLMNSKDTLTHLTTVSAVFALFDESNLPYTNIFLRLKNDSDLEYDFANLKSSLAGSGLNAKKANDTGSFYLLMLDVILFAFLALSVIIASVLIFFSLGTISEKRLNEMRSFELSGVPAKSIFISLCIETFVYILIGTFIGISISSLLITDVISDILRFKHPILSHHGILTAIIAEFAIWLITLSLHKLSLSKKDGEKKGIPSVVLLTVAAVAFILCILTLSVKAKIKYTLTIPAILSILLCMLLFVKPLLKFISEKLSLICETLGGKTGSVSYLALKNGERINHIHNIYRSASIVLSVFLVMTVCLGYCGKLVASGENVFDCDISVVNVPDSELETVKNTDGVTDATSAFFVSGQIESANQLFIISADNKNFLTSKGHMAPVKNGIIIANSLAELYSVKAGDEISITIADKKYTFIIQDLYDGNPLFAYIDAEANGFNNNLILAKTNGSENVISDISGKVSFFGGFCDDTQRLTEDTIYYSKTFYRLMSVYMKIVGILAAVGCINLICVSMAERRSNLYSLSLIGVSKKEIISMLFFEATCALILISILSIASSTIFVYLLDAAFNSFGHTIL